MQEFHATMRTILQERKSELIKNLLAENADFEETIKELGAADSGDIASNDFERRTLEAIGAQNTMALTKIDTALARIENGAYGVCVKCGNMIDKERLLAIPETVLCIKCKTLNERGR